jgi:isocitrate lyase
MARSSSSVAGRLPEHFLDTPSQAQEEAFREELTKSLDGWLNSPRFKHTKRPYGAEAIASKRGTLPVSPADPANLAARKLYALLSRAAERGEPIHTLGAIDPVQQSQMAYNQDVVYVSGWASSSVLTTGNNEVGPDLADYPYTTVPNQVHRLAKAQRLHDRKMWDERVSSGGSSPWVDYLRPIIADGDTG